MEHDADQTADQAAERAAERAVEAVEVRIASGDVTLAGTLWLPGGPGPHAGVVMVGGSGSSDRHNDTLFPPIREHLLGAGVAVLSYDKRGVGASGGAWQDATMDDLATDARHAFEALRGRPEVSTVGLFGHSEGGWVVLRAAAGRDDVRFVVTNSGPGMTPAEQDRYGLAETMRADGVAEPDVRACVAFYDELRAAGDRDAGFTDVKELLAGVPPALRAYNLDLDERLWRFLERKQNHDPVTDVRRLRCPHLALFGGADRLVPVAESIAIFAGVACEPGRPERYHFTTRVFPGADHRILVDGAPAPGYLDALTGWIAAAS